MHCERVYIGGKVIWVNCKNETVYMCVSVCVNVFSEDELIQPGRNRRNKCWLSSAAAAFHFLLFIVAKKKEKKRAEPSFSLWIEKETHHFDMMIYSYSGYIPLLRLLHWWKHTRKTKHNKTLELHVLCIVLLLALFRCQGFFLTTLREKKQH